MINSKNYPRKKTSKIKTCLRLKAQTKEVQGIAVEDRKRERVRKMISIRR